jgi:hypothetical protein
MTPTPNKDTNINFRVTEQRKLKLQKEAESKKMTLSDYLNKIIEKYHEPPKIDKIARPIQQDKEETKIDNGIVYFFIGTVGLAVIVWIWVSAKKRPQ